MDRELLESRLRQLEDNIELGERHIERQREFVAQFDGDADLATALLTTFQVWQATYIAERDRILNQLGRASIGHSPWDGHGSAREARD